MPADLLSGTLNRGGCVFAVEVSDHIMIAHSFRGELFGPAQALHGATFAISAAFLSKELDAYGVVVDIGRASEVLKEVLAPINYRNLDNVPAFRGVNTTTEFLTRYIFDQLTEAVRGGRVGREPKEIASIRVTIGESPTAQAWYEGPVW
jgi:6-pyruvoyl-tetrahydropterin synthase